MSKAVAPSCYTNGQYNGDTLLGSYLLGPYNLYAQSSVIDRDNVLNIHFGIPQKNGLKDDIQLLGMVNYIQNPYYSSTNDQGGAAFLANTTLGVPGFIDGYIYNGPTGQPLPSDVQSRVSPYGFPNTPSHALNVFAPIPAAERDGFENDQAIYKLQYTHNFSTTALLKLYGYTYYSDWLNTGPQTGWADYIGSVSLDYELSSHTHGLSGSFIDQINSQNLLNLTGSWTTSRTVRDNNTTMINGLYGPNSVNARTALAVVVSAANPTNGVCYDPNGNATTCAERGGYAQYLTLQQAYAGQNLTLPTSCGGSACEYYTVGNGNYATYNQVKPTFNSGSLTDEFKPNSRLTINGGMRFDDFEYTGSNTSGTGARTLFYNAYNMDTCQDNAGNLYDKVANLGGSITQPCSAFSINGTPLKTFTVTNPPGQVTQTFQEWQPRLGATYSLDPFTVLRASYGRYAQGPNSAFVQYDALQQNAPALLYGTYAFNKFGFTTPDHGVRPEVSNNYDFSIEHQFKGDVSVKITPFYRKTQDQIQQFYLNQQTSFVSGLNVGRQTSDGLEFELDKGDFSRQGLSARLTFAYTNSYINYTALSNGSSVITPLNLGISNYNAYTSACAPGGKDYGKSQFGQPLCGATVSGNAASPCYFPATSSGPGAPDPSCGPNSVANPYWNAPAQGFLDPNGNYPTFDLLPGGIGSSYNSYGAPYVSTLAINERVGRFSVTPIFQFFAGQRYGAPASTEGVAPEFCGALASGIAGDPRYPYGAPGGAPFNALSCGATLGAGIPNVDTGAFDGIGAFVAPSQLQMHLQLSYEASKNVTLVGNLTNIIDNCFGGTSVKWSVSNACGYTGLAGGNTGGVGNTYNPGATIEPLLNRPYAPTFRTFPFEFFLNAKIKI
jgi:outer membrane receptor protein involved in Fe transport